MTKIYGPSYKQARKERMKFAEGRCEFCGASEFRLECHHRGKEAYERDRANEMTMKDCVIVCVLCHDRITDKDREKRKKKVIELTPQKTLENIYVKKRKKSISLEPTKELGITRHGKRKSKVNWFGTNPNA